jgi:hypothetical protein
MEQLASIILLQIGNDSVAIALRQNGGHQSPAHASTLCQGINTDERQVVAGFAGMVWGALIRFTILSRTFGLAQKLRSTSPSILTARTAPNGSWPYEGERRGDRA